MKYLYVYARISDGYECVNKDQLQSFSSDKRSGASDFDRLESFRVFTPPTKQTDDFPEELYFYKERFTNCGLAYVIGRTNFIRAGESKLSGERDTCMIQKHIYTEEDIDELDKNVDSIFTQRTYFDTVDDFCANENSKRYGLEELTDWKSFILKSGIQEECFKKLVIACANAFISDGRKVYVVLPSNDKKGTQFALNLARAVFYCLPQRILRGAGFVTYSPSFENISSNPIPNSVPLVFIQRSEENESPRGIIQKNDTYFDFVKEVFINSDVDRITIMGINRLFDTMNSSKFWPTVNKYCDECFNENAVLNASVFFSWLLLLLGKYEKEEAISALHHLFTANSLFTEIGKGKICSCIDKITSNLPLDDDLLGVCGEIYNSDIYFKKKIIVFLCRKCQEFFEKNREDIFSITDYEYVNPELNDDIIDEIYSNPSLFDVGDVIFWATVEPVVSKKELDQLEKYEKVMKFIANDFIGSYDRFISAKILDKMLAGVISELREIIKSDGFEDAINTTMVFEGINQKYLAKSNYINANMVNKSICSTVAEALIRSGRAFSKGKYTRKICEWIEHYNLYNDKRFSGFLSEMEDRQLNRILFEDDISSTINYLERDAARDPDWISKHENMIYRFIESRHPAGEEEYRGFLVAYSWIIEFDLLRRGNRLTHRILNNVLNRNNGEGVSYIMNLYNRIISRGNIDRRVLDPCFDDCLRDYVRNNPREIYTPEQRKFFWQFRIDVSFCANTETKDAEKKKGFFGGLFSEKRGGKRNKDEQDVF